MFVEAYHQSSSPHDVSASSELAYRFVGPNAETMGEALVSSCWRVRDPGPSRGLHNLVHVYSEISSLSCVSYTQESLLRVEENYQLEITIFPLPIQRKGCKERGWRSHGICSNRWALKVLKKMESLWGPLGGREKERKAELTCCNFALEGLFLTSSFCWNTHKGYSLSILCHAPAYSYGELANKTKSCALSRELMSSLETLGFPWGSWHILWEVLNLVDFSKTQICILWYAIAISLGRKEKKAHIYIWA